ncbi:zinc finger domain-containing protein [Streptomyces sp. NBC_00670]|uniref:zinc finger domain-containing protein n=1 Tax=Streptomyces sp. NBC_00670 TaxID=2975804 RepID=UPI002E327C2C|nr:hypothetical protein [Streptomyces sp. NBC_00670]
MTEQPTPAQTLPALAVACDTCGAQPGSLCTSHSGTRVRRHDVHRTRSLALQHAEAKAAAAPEDASLPSARLCTDPRHTGPIREQFGCNGPDPAATFAEQRAEAEEAGETGDRAVVRAAALREAADQYAQLTDQNEAYDRANGELNEDARIRHETVRDVVAGLRRLADEQPTPDALARVRTVLETEAVAGRTALEYRGLILSALMADEQPTTPTEDPARIDRLRPEFFEHASIEAIDSQIRRAQTQQRAWGDREWTLGILRQARVVQQANPDGPAGPAARAKEAQLQTCECGGTLPHPECPVHTPAKETQPAGAWTVKVSTRRYAEKLRLTPGQAAADGHTGWQCDAGASLLVAASTPGPGALGTHHGTIYACAAHRDAAVERITSAGYEADPQPAPPGHRWDPWPCGHVTAHGTESLAALTAGTPSAADGELEA